MSEEIKDAAAQLYNEAPKSTDETPADEQVDQNKEEQQQTEDKPKATEQETEKPAEEKPKDEDDGKPDEEKKGDEDSKAAAPEKYELIIPKDSKLENADIERIASYARERGLSNEQAQEIVKVETEAVERFVAKDVDRLKDLSEGEWVETVKNDKEIGGDDYGKNVEMAKRVVSKFADEAFVEELQVTGFDNHPGLTKMLVRIGKQMSEDSLKLPTMQAGPSKSIEELFYGKQES